MSLWQNCSKGNGCLLTHKCFEKHVLRSQILRLQSFVSFARHGSGVRRPAPKTGRVRDRRSDSPIGLLGRNLCKSPVAAVCDRQTILKMQCFGGHRPPLQSGRRLLQRFLGSVAVFRPSTFRFRFPVYPPCPSCPSWSTSVSAFRFQVCLSGFRRRRWSASRWTAK
jgi:hypothetical protein